MRIKLIALAAIVLLLPGCDFVKSTDVAARYVAKMTCSCIYVVERDAQSCAADLPEVASQISLKNDADKKQVNASVLFFIKAKAQYTEGEGCKLVG